MQDLLGFLFYVFFGLTIFIVGATILYYIIKNAIINAHLKLKEIDRNVEKIKQNHPLMPKSTNTDKFER